MKLKESRRLVSLGFYLGATLLCCAVAVWFFALWRGDLRIPFAYGVKDEAVMGLWVKWAMESNWMLYNPHLGMPFRSELFSVPQPDVLIYLEFKLLGLATRHFGLVMNLFYLLSYPATFLCALYVFRQFKAGYPASLLGSFLYAFLPYHFLRGESHLFLSAYYFVPLVVLLIFQVASENPPFLSQGGRWPRLTWRNSAIGAIVICLAAGLSGMYYAFFACFLLIIAGLAVSAAQRRLAPLFSALLLASLIGITVLLALSPYLLHGRGNAVARGSGDAETYALKISQLLLPVSGHRLPVLAALKSNYAETAPLINENDAVALGSLGSLGFIFLLCWAALRLVGANLKWPSKDDQQVLSLAALLTIAATLLGTIGGLGSLFSVLISPQIRAYNRISIYIAFFSILAVVLLIDRGIGARLEKQSSKALYVLGLTLLTIAGLFDQTTSLIVPNYATVRAAFLADGRFVRAIEKQLPPGAMVFQLPYMTFPEASSYDLARGYLHSRRLRWSYGAMINGPSDLWQRKVHQMPASEMIQALAGAGFSGIYLDRRLLPENGALHERELKNILGEPTAVSVASQLSFFSLKPAKDGGRQP